MSASSPDDAGAVPTPRPETPSPTGQSILRVTGAEVVGTAVLMLVGPGSAILAGDVIGAYGVAFAFGLALLAMAYTIGHVSGCHINPAVTLGFLLSRKITVVEAAYYWIAQIAGAALGGLLLYLVTEGGDLDKTGVFAANGWGDDIGSPFGLGSAIVVEIVFTALLVFVVLSTTTVGYPTGFGGLAAGLTLAMIHLATIPVDNTSVNPARSIGAAIFSGSDAMTQLWAFIVFPLIGAVVGVVVWLVVHDTGAEDESLRRFLGATRTGRAQAGRVP
jgi:aquaporin Z